MKGKERNEKEGNSHIRCARIDDCTEKHCLYVFHVWMMEACKVVGFLSVALFFDFHFLHNLRKVGIFDPKYYSIFLLCLFLLLQLEEKLVTSCMCNSQHTLVFLHDFFNRE